MQEISDLKVVHDGIKNDNIDQILNEISHKMGYRESKHIAYCVLKIILHTIRDDIPFRELFNFAEQLPLFMRGIFFEGYQPEEAPYIIYNKELVKRYHERMGPGNRERFENFLLSNQPERISREEMVNKIRKNIINEGYKNSDQAIQTVFEIIHCHVSGAEPGEIDSFNVPQKYNRIATNKMKPNTVN